MMMKQSQQSTTFQTGFTRVTEKIRADVTPRYEMIRFEDGDGCFIAPTTNGKLKTSATSSYILPSRTPQLLFGRNQKSSGFVSAPGPLEQKI